MIKIIISSYLLVSTASYEFDPTLWDTQSKVIMFLTFFGLLLIKVSFSNLKITKSK
jgi:hypothetical protein